MTIVCTAPVGALLAATGLALALLKDRLVPGLYWGALSLFALALTSAVPLLCGSSDTAPVALAVPPVLLGFVWNGLWVRTRASALPAPLDPAVSGRLARRLWVPLSPLVALTGLLFLGGVLR